MTWKKNLTADPTPWLLEPEIPPVRYLTLRDLLDRPADDSEMRDAREAIPSWPPLAELLESQHPQGYWVKPDFYLPRASLGTFWVLTVLGDLGLTRENDQVCRACDFMFGEQRENGAFCRHRRVAKKGIVWEETGEPCTQARIIRFMIQFGYWEDPRVRQGFEWLLERQRDDGLWFCRGEKGKGCLRATIDVLRVAALIPEMKEHPGIQQGAAAVSELSMEPGMYRYHVGERWGTWENLKYPYYGFSALSALNALAYLGWTAADPGVRKALDYVISRQGSDGRWLLDEAWPEAPLDFGKPGKPNKWITLDAMWVVKTLV